MLAVPPTQEALSTPSVARRWHEEAVEWIERERRTTGHYTGRGGDDSVRILTRIGEALEASDDPRSPRTFRDSDVLRVLSWFGTAPTTKRFYASILSSFLRSRGNDAVRKSRVLSAIPNETQNRRWLTAEQLEAMLDRAIGVERVIVALEGYQGLRRVEVSRARLADLDSSGPVWWLQVRGKAHRGYPSRKVPIRRRARSELDWFLALRAQWAQEATAPQELVVWKDGDRLRPYSVGGIDTLVRRAGARVWLKVSNHDLRRTFGRILKNRGADWREIAGLYGHASIAQSEYYVGQEPDRLASAIALLESR